MRNKLGEHRESTKKAKHIKLKYSKLRGALERQQKFFGGGWVICIFLYVYVYCAPGARICPRNSHNFRVPLSLVEPLPRQRFKDLLNEEVPQTTDRSGRCEQQKVNWGCSTDPRNLASSV